MAVSEPLPTFVAPMPAELVRSLGRIKTDRDPEPDALVFVADRGGFLDHSVVTRRVLRPAAEEAGASWAGFDTFCHTCASMLFERGANAVRVQRWLGHHSPAFTLETYVHLLDGQLGEPLDLTPELATGDNSVTTGPTQLDPNVRAVERSDALNPAALAGPA